jgi:hypothetical protein
MGVITDHENKNDSVVEEVDNGANHKTGAGDAEGPAVVIQEKGVRRDEATAQVGDEEYEMGEADDAVASRRISEEETHAREQTRLARPRGLRTLHAKIPAAIYWLLRQRALESHLGFKQYLVKFLSEAWAYPPEDIPPAPEPAASGLPGHDEPANAKGQR